MRLLQQLAKLLHKDDAVSHHPGRRMSHHAMDLASSEIQFLGELAGEHRVLLLGRAATVAHGGPFPNRDYEVWMEPLGSETEWTRQLNRVVTSFLHLKLGSPRSGLTLDLRSAEEAVKRAGAVDVIGFDVPLTIYRSANEFNIEEFERVWERSTELAMGIRLPSVMDLFLNKINTGRHSDYEDMLYLEQRVKDVFAQRLPECDEAEATALLERYIDPDCLRHALINPNSAVRDMAQAHLKRFADAGDPYSAEILECWQLEYCAGNV